MAFNARSALVDARSRLHGLLRVSSIYVSPQGVETPVGVRLHTNLAMIGELPGQKGPGYAERVELAPRIAFLDSEGVTPERGGIVSVSTSEAWRVEYVKPSDGVVTIAEVSEVRGADLAGLPVPA